MAYAPSTGYQGGVAYQAAPAYQSTTGYSEVPVYQGTIQYQGNPWQAPEYPNSAPVVYCPLPPDSGSVLPPMVFPPVLPPPYPPH